ncbi:MAG: DNA cytosine methyltransferase [Reyranellaceae bacterium]
MLRPGEIVVDNFAGGGGASTGIEAAIGRSVDVAINHDPEAIAMHMANHPTTKHYCESVWDVDPVEACAGRPVGLAWFSPDCKHFSKAKGGKPVSKQIRGLAWVVVRWAAAVSPRVIMLENVEEFQTWGPLLGDRPDPARRGVTFKRWCTRLRNLGYALEWRELAAKDYDTPTIRKRLFIVARRDGEPISWPRPTNGPAIGRGDLFAATLKPYRAVAECIDWTTPCRSIFERERPLAEATLRRIARGVQRFVIDAADPFIVKFQQNSVGQTLDEPLHTVMAGAPRFGLVAPYTVPITHRGDDRVHDIREPARTFTTANRGEHALVAPYMVPRYGERDGQEPRSLAIDAPMPTIVPTGNGGSLVAAYLDKHNGESVGARLADPLPTATVRSTQLKKVAVFLAQHNAGPNNARMAGRDLRQPVSTVTASGSQQQLVASHLVKLKGTAKDGQSVAEPLHTVQTARHYAEVRAFLIKYYGQGTGQTLAEPAHAVTTKARFGLVTVEGVDYAIVDIGMRMLEPRELYRAQGFPDSYVIDPMVEGGKRLNKTAQYRMVGNSVCPPVATALVLANLRRDSDSDSADAAGREAA